MNNQKLKTLEGYTIEVDTIQNCGICSEDYFLAEGNLLIRFGAYFEFTCKECLTLTPKQIKEATNESK